MAMDMNKTIEQASLDNLNDIIVPDAVGFFPLAPGWIIVAVLALTLLFHMAFKRYQYYKRTQYKREALQELHCLASQNAEATVSLLALAKRVGIAAYGREKVAKLDGDLWWDFMEQHAKVKVNRALRDALAALLYDKNVPFESSTFKEVKSIVHDWIKTHREVGNV